jgi:hypothetical protein
MGCTGRWGPAESEVLLLDFLALVARRTSRNDRNLWVGAAMRTLFGSPDCRRVVEWGLLRRLCPNPFASFALFAVLVEGEFFVGFIWVQVWLLVFPPTIGTWLLSKDLGSQKSGGKDASPIPSLISARRRARRTKTRWTGFPLLRFPDGDCSFLLPCRWVRFVAIVACCAGCGELPKACRSARRNYPHTITPKDPLLHLAFQESLRAPSTCRVSPSDSMGDVETRWDI